MAIFYWADQESKKAVLQREREISRRLQRQAESHLGFWHVRSGYTSSPHFRECLCELLTLSVCFFFFFPPVCWLESIFVLATTKFLTKTDASPRGGQARGCQLLLAAIPRRGPPASRAWGAQKFTLTWPRAPLNLFTQQATHPEDLWVK